MRTLVVLVCIALSACATAPAAPRVVTKEVLIEKSVPCKIQPPTEPEWPDTDAAILAAPNVFERGKLFVAGRLLRIAYEAELRAALSACQ